MNLTNRPVYQKQPKANKSPTKAQRERWSRLAEMGCVLTLMGVDHECRGLITIQHCFTGGGGRKDHSKVVPMCWESHLGPNGIDGRVNYSKKTWQEKYVTEAEMLEFIEGLENKSSVG